MKKKQLLLNDNPIDIIGLFIGLIAIGAQLILYSVFLMDPDFSPIAPDSLSYVLRGTAALMIMFVSRLIFQSKKGKKQPIIGNQFDPEDILLYVLCIACYFGIQLIIMALSETIFQVTAVQVYFFFITGGEIEELIYRGALIMFIQGLLVFIYEKNGMKVKNNSDLLPINVICVLISGMLFVFAHGRYLTNFATYSITILGGFSQAFWYVKTKNITVPMLAHAAINFVAAGSLVATYNLI
ncbi:CPBP family glutamic-type intramembrane protease [Candidatus Harpocratesius sp.]